MTMLLRIGLIAAVFACSGCLSDRSVMVPTYAPARSKVADENGWYHYTTYKFRGELHDGLPEGKGYCRTEYSKQATTEKKWVEAPCEFRAGVRIDEQHQMLAESSLVQFREQRAKDLAREKEEQRQAEEWERQRKEEQRKSDAAFHEALRSELGNLQNNMNRSWAEAEAGSRGSSIEEDRAKAKYLSDFNDSISRMEADPYSDLNRDKRAREQERAEEKRADSVRAAKLEAAKKVSLASDTRRETEKSSQSDAAANARKKQQAEELKAQQEQEKQRLDAERRSQELRDIAERKRVAAAEEAKQKANRERQARAEEQIAADQNKSTEALLKSKWGGSKKIVKLSEPCGGGKTEAEARSNCKIGWQNFKREIEYTHEKGMAYGIIRSTGETTCRTMSRWTTGKDLGGDWMCRVDYAKEVLDTGGDRPSKGISR